eukprot:TRINITY_DN539_c0_g1_i5.p1 TRINITY_DN539_c0_g1~~TRINITY_DN539_c0_g1_i5.p1  ORF type:complete len:486 (+),score=136.22 TRINITY_DN539_c0_g1_i5:57-1460(+)
MDIPLKVTFTRRGDIECMRRVTLYNPSLQVVYDRVKEWSKGSFELGYKDDEGDIIAMDTEVEWEECVRLWKEIVNKSDNKFAPLRLEAKKTKPHREHREKKQREAAANDPVAAPQQQTIQQTEDVVDQILTFIMGEDMRNSLVLGVVSPADFGLDSWLKISHYQINNNGQRHVDADMRELNRFLQSQGLQSLNRHDFSSAVRWFQFQTQLFPASVSYYNLACSHSRNLNCEDALTAFEKSLELGYNSLSHILCDCDLDPLREVPEFTQIMTKYFGSSIREYEEETRRLADLEGNARRLAAASAGWTEAQRRQHEENEREGRYLAEEAAREKKESEEVAKRVAEAEAKRYAEEMAKQAEEARLQAEEEARRQAEEEARSQAEEEARRQAEEEARREAERLATERAVEETRRAFEEQRAIEVENERMEVKVSQVSQQLSAMGFTVDEGILQLIRKHNCSAENVLTELLA